METQKSYQDTIYNTIVNMYEKYVAVLSVLKDVNIGDKISWYEDKEPMTPDGKDKTTLMRILDAHVEIDKPTYLSSLYRWYYGQSRTQTLEYFTLLKQHYSKILDDVCYGATNNGISGKYITFAKEITVFNESIIPGFMNLQETYKEDEMIRNVLSEFIKIMTAFKANTQDLRPLVTTNRRIKNTPNPSNFLEKPKPVSNYMAYHHDY
jgi:hypothetical protein